MDELNGLLSKLKMEHLEAQLPSLCEQAAKQDLDYQAFLAEALRAEWQGRFQRGVETKLRQSRFPWTRDPGPVRLRLPAQPGSPLGS
jgi:DNA replication protein DnaC